MTTRSLIGMQHTDGTITAVYCQCDGYPSYNGNVLREHYTDMTQVEALMALGEIDMLGKTPAAFADEEEASRSIAGTGYPPVKAKTAITCNDDVMPAATYTDRAAYIKAGRDCCAEYMYLFVDGAWLVGVPHSEEEEQDWTSIDEAISKDEQEGF